MTVNKNTVAAASTASTGLVKKKLADFENLLTPYQLKISQIAPKKGLQADRILRMAATTIWMNEKLHNCDPRSILMSVMQLAMCGLNPSPQFKEAYLIPYGNQCQMQLSYLGIIKMAMKSALIKSVWATSVYEGDFFEPTLGLNPDIIHKRGPNFGDASKFTDVYAVVVFANGERIFEVLNKVQVDRLRRKNKMQGGAPAGAWATDYDQMAKAKAIKAILKVIPLEDEYRSAIFLDEQIASSDQFDQFGGVEPITPIYADESEGSAEVLANDAPPATDDGDPLAAQLAKEQAEAQQKLNLGQS